MFTKIKKPVLVSIFKEIHKTQKELNQLEKEYNRISASQENIIDGIIIEYIKKRNREFENFKNTITVKLSSLGRNNNPSIYSREDSYFNNKNDNDYFMELKSKRWKY
mgnify:CR=1 FL=1